jgi:hypothetical protein
MCSISPSASTSSETTPCSPPMATVLLSTLLEILVFDALVEILRAVDIQKQLCTVRIATRPARLHVQLFLSTGAAAVFFTVHTVPKTKQISESIGEEVPWRGNFPIIRGNDA